MIGQPFIAADRRRHQVFRLTQLYMLNPSQVLLQMITLLEPIQMHLSCRTTDFYQSNTMLSIIAFRFPYSTYFYSINVEWAYGKETAKYVATYNCKGGTMAFVVKEHTNVVDVDEFHQLNIARFITSQEAMMGLLKFPLIRMSHTV